MPQVALVSCLIFIFYIFRKDFKTCPRFSKALWVPLIWMFLAGSRYVSQWLSLSAPVTSVDSYSEGSPVDRIVFFSLVAIGVLILSRRDIAWNELLYENTWLVLYLLYCLASIGWSDEPFVLLKRWTKDLGNPIMALIVLTEAQPYEAVGIT